MSHQVLFTFLIIIYILSLVICIVSASLSKKIPSVISYSLIAIHFLLMFISIGMFFAQGKSTYQSLLFALAFCSGNIIFGLISRKVLPLSVKIYFGIFVLSFPVFAVSPSTLISIISFGELHKNADDKVSLQNNFYLEKQQAMINKSTAKDLGYKVIKRIGYFNKTIARDLYFSGNKIDSAKIIKLTEGISINVRGYFKNQAVNSADSIDVQSVIIQSARDTLIQIRKNKKQ